MTAAPNDAAGTVLVVDMANVVGSVPDGWWRDRAAAAERLLTGLAALSGATVTGPETHPLRLARILAVLEGRANLAAGGQSQESEGPEIIRATGSGDDAIVALAVNLIAAEDHVLVVTADRGLRARLPALVATTGPRWLNGLLGRE